MSSLNTVPAIALVAAAVLGSGPAKANLIDDQYGVGAGSFELGKFTPGGGPAITTSKY
jgi:hypothetical protein